MTGQRFTRLLVLRRMGSTPRGQACWRCKCDCGNVADVVGAVLRRGSTQSCGCLAAENASRRRATSPGRKHYGRLAPSQMWGADYALDAYALADVAADLVLPAPAIAD